MVADFLIVGGGIAGISVAARLAPHGTTVVLEKESALGYHASGRSAALFEQNYGLPSTVALNAASFKYLKIQNGGVLSRRGFMLLGGDNDQKEFENDKVALSLDELSVTDARGIVPILDESHVTRAAYHRDTWDIDTDLLLQGFRTEARSHGAHIKTNAEVKSISQSQKHWQVETAEELFRARIIINAAGPWADRIALMAGVEPIGLQPFRRSMGRIPAPGGHDISNWPMIFGPGESWYAKPDAGALIVSPADEDPMEPHDAFADDMVLAEGFARYEANVTEPVTRLLSSWAGLRTFAPDRQLVLGRDTRESSFFWCAGQGGYGMQSSPAASQVVADEVLENSSTVVTGDIVNLLSPSRFI